MKSQVNTLLLSILIALTLAILALVIIFVSKVADVNAPTEPQTSQIVTDDEVSLEGDMIDNDDIRPADGVTPDNVPDANLDFVTYTDNEIGFSMQVPDNLNFAMDTGEGENFLIVQNGDDSLESPQAILYFADRPAGDRGGFWGDVGNELFTGSTLAEICERATDPANLESIYNWVDTCNWTSGNKAGTPMATFTGNYSGFSATALPITVYVFPHPSIEGRYIALSMERIRRNYEDYSETVLTLQNLEDVGLRMAQYLEVFEPTATE